MDLSPPTDSLYKFVAFLGISIVLGSCWVTGQLWRAEAESRTPLVKEAAALIQVDGSYDKLKMEKLTAEADYWNKLVSSFTKIYTSTAALGTVIAMTGFWFWYFNLQRHKDCWVQMKVAELKEKSKSEKQK